MKHDSKIIISSSNTAQHNFFNLMDSGLASYFGVPSHSSLKKEVIHAGLEFLFCIGRQRQ